MKILKFYSNNCAPCKVLSPLVSVLGQELAIDIEHVNVATRPELVDEFNVRAVPTLVLISETEETLGSITGLKTKDALRQWIEESI